MKAFIITTLMVLVLYGHAFLYGSSDILVAVLLLVTSLILTMSMIKLHSGNREMLRVNTKQDSALYRFLSGDKKVTIWIVAFLSSLLLSAVLVVLIKGLVIQQGYLPIFVTIIIGSLVLYMFINTEVRSETIEENVHQDISSHGSQLARILYSAIILNLILALAFSAYDTFDFKTSDVSFENFTDKAVESSIERTDSNEYSRLFINAYLLMDYMKVAMAKMFVELFNMQDNFYGFYLFIFFFNMLKLFAFSVSFVILQRGFDETAAKLTPIARHRWKQFLSVASLYGGKLYTKMRSKVNTWKTKGKENKENTDTAEDDKGAESA